MSTSYAVHNRTDSGISVSRKEWINILSIGVLLILIIFSFSLSFFVFSNESLRLDESQSLWQTSHTPERMIEIVAEDVHVPLYHFFLNFWQFAFGNEVKTARMMSMIFFLLAIPAIYVLGRRIFNWKVGLLAATFIAISPFLNWYGNEIRMYSLLTFLVILNQLFYLSVFTDREENRSKPAYLIGYALTAILGIYTHYFFGFTLLTQAIFFFLFRKNFPEKMLSRFVIIGIIVIVSFMPWAYFVYTSGSAENSQPMLTEPTTINIFNTFSQFIFGFQSDEINTILISLWPLLVLFLFMSLRRNQKISPQVSYLFFSLFIPIILAFMISVFIRPIYLTRYLVIALPSLYLLIGWVISTYPRKMARVATTFLIVMMLATLAMEITNAHTPVRENYREASEFLTRYAEPQDIIVLSAPFTIYPIEYYYRGQSTISTLPIWDRYSTGSVPDFNPDTLPEQVDELKEGRRIVWLLLSYDQGYEKDVKSYFDNNYEKILERQFSPGLNLYGFRIRYDEPMIDNPSLTSMLGSKSQ